jgi:hypothetical protein
MKVEWVKGAATLAIAAMVFGSAALGWAQYRTSANGPLGTMPGTRPEGDTEEGTRPNPIWGAQRLRALNTDRQKSLVSDTDKLLKLARQLDAEIASNPTDELTPQELRKIGEIEKLARDVKAKMVQSFGEGPRLRISPIPMGGPGLP